MSNICHYIKPNEGSRGYPHLLAFVDTETTHRVIENDTIVNDLQFGVVEFWRRRRDEMEYEPWGQQHPFRTRDEFFEVLLEHTRPRRTLWTFAHNMDFDWQVLGGFEQMQARDWELSRMILESPPFLLDYAQGPRRIKFVDSMNWFRMSLAALAGPLGLRKMEDPGVGADWLERLPYCRNDVTILREAMRAWIRYCREHDMGTFSISQAQQAMQAFRHRFMSYTIQVNHDPEVASLERAAYVGGRTEAFLRGDVAGSGHAGEVAHLDVNSLYPSVMRDGMFPARYGPRRSRGDLQFLHETLQRGMGAIAEVEIRTDQRWYPLRAERVTFPTGQFWTTLATPELQKAIDHGHIVSVGRVQTYFLEPLFVEFVEYFYGERLKFRRAGNEVFAFICKIFMNSLYGKFGQLTPEWRQVDEPGDLVDILPEHCASFRVCRDGVTRLYRRVMNIVEERVARVEADNAMCAIAAHVTSYARLRLLEGIQAAGEEQVYYVDTDSVFCSQQGRARMIAAGLVDPSRLGAWKDEGNIQTMTIHGAKDYVADGVVKRKGVRFNARPVGVASFLQEMFISITGALRRGHPEEQRVMTIQKTLSREYKKGVVLKCGAVTPSVMVVRGGVNAVEVNEVVPCPRCGCWETAEFADGVYQIDRRCGSDR